MKRAREYVVTYGLLAFLLLLIIIWTVPAVLLLSPLPRRWRKAAARYSMMGFLRLFVGALTVSGAYELDLRALDTLRGGPPLVLAPNHPTSIDALFILSRHPDLVCILKPELMGNFALGAIVRLAGFVRSDPPRRMIREAVAELRRGSSVLLFPEGTRTVHAPLNPLLTDGVGVIARHAPVPVQVAIIETDFPYLAKGWPIFKVPQLPIRFRVRLGPRLEPDRHAADCTAAIRRELTRELADAPQNRWLAARDASHGRALLNGR